MGRTSWRNREREIKKINDDVKEEICSLIRRIATEERWTQKELAWRLGITQARTSYIIRYQTHLVSADQLFICLAVLKPNFRLLIAL